MRPFFGLFCWNKRRSRTAQAGYPVHSCSIDVDNSGNARVTETTSLLRHIALEIVKRVEQINEYPRTKNFIWDFNVVSSMSYVVLSLINQ